MKRIKWFNFADNKGTYYVRRDGERYPWGWSILPERLKRILKNAKTEEAV